MFSNSQSTYFAGHSLESDEGERITANYPELRMNTDLDSVREFMDAIDVEQTTISQFITKVLEEGEASKYYATAKALKAASQERR